MKKILITFIAITLLLATTKTTSASKIGIDPSLFTINAAPGANIKSSFQFNSDIGSNYQFVIRRFDADGTQGQIKILPADPTDPLTSWVVISPSTINITSENPQTINFQINLPNNAPEADYYFVILALPISQNVNTEQNQAIISSGIATNFILSVSRGNPSEGQLQLILNGNKVFLPNNIKLQLIAKNDQSKYRTIEGKVLIHALLSRATDESLDLIPQNVLGRTQRELTTSKETNTEPAVYPTINKPGIYQAWAETNISDHIFKSNKITYIVLPTTKSLIGLMLAVAIMTLFAVLLKMILKRS